MERCLLILFIINSNHIFWDRINGNIILNWLFLKSFTHGAQHKNHSIFKTQKLKQTIDNKIYLLKLFILHILIFVAFEMYGQEVGPKVISSTYYRIHIELIDNH